MSYCRFSHDSDVYCYGSIDDCVVIIVAKNRHVNPIPFPKFTDEILADIDRLTETVSAQERWYKEATLVPIGLPDDGCELIAEDELHAASILEGLRVKGYQVPDYAVESLLADAER